MNQRSLRVIVHGRPAPQGSKRHVGGGRMIEQSRYVHSWREAVKTAVIIERGGRPPLRLDGPLLLTVTFVLDRPRSHYRTGRNAHLLRAGAPAYPVGPPDLSKLVRATEDALTDVGAWVDDARIVDSVSRKRWAPAFLDHPGAVITVDAMGGAW